ncbi:hypothetical protein A2U01_0085392, partial [Trifolium medium]|nr:hypothetical protein [Trifolium medium]
MDEPQQDTEINPSQQEILEQPANQTDPPFKSTNSCIGDSTAK